MSIFGSPGLSENRVSSSTGESPIVEQEMVTVDGAVAHAFASSDIFSQERILRLIQQEGIETKSKGVRDSVYVLMRKVPAAEAFSLIAFLKSEEGDNFLETLSRENAFELVLKEAIQLSYEMVTSRGNASFLEGDPVLGEDRILHTIYKSRAWSEQGEGDVHEVAQREGVYNRGIIDRYGNMQRLLRPLARYIVQEKEQWKSKGERESFLSALRKEANLAEIIASFLENEDFAENVQEFHKNFRNDSLSRLRKEAESFFAHLKEGENGYLEKEVEHALSEVWKIYVVRAVYNHPVVKKEIHNFLKTKGRRPSQQETVEMVQKFIVEILQQEVERRLDSLEEEGDYREVIAGLRSESYAQKQLALSDRRAERIWDKIQKKYAK